MVFDVALLTGINIQFFINGQNLNIASVNSGGQSVNS